MDGTPLDTLRTRLRLLAATALAAAALLALGARPASADPAAQWPAQGAAVTTAIAIATDYWGFPACHGQIAVSWDRLAPGINGNSTWSNPLDPYRQPSRNTDCAITLSTVVDWDWPMLCTVLVHEVGHLTGRRHSPDPGDVMAAYYSRPLRQCAETPEPVEPAPADPLASYQAALPAPVATPARPAAAAKSPAAKAKAPAPRGKAGAKPRKAAKARSRR